MAWASRIPSPNYLSPPSCMHPHPHTPGALTAERERQQPVKLLLVHLHPRLAEEVIYH